MCSSSTLGNKQFGFAMEQALAGHVDMAIPEVTQSTLKKGHHILPHEEVLKCKMLCAERVDAMYGIDVMPDRRDITFQYRTIDVTVGASCLGGQIDYKVWG